MAGFVNIKTADTIEEKFIVFSDSTKGHVLQANEVYVFGTNLPGYHGFSPKNEYAGEVPGKGKNSAAGYAMSHFNAVFGLGFGPQRLNDEEDYRSFAIPTVLERLVDVKYYVDEFILFAKTHKEKIFLVTAVGCGNAGWSPEEIAPLFRDARLLANVFLAEAFAKVIDENKYYDLQVKNDDVAQAANVLEKLSYCDCYSGNIKDIKIEGHKLVRIPENYPENIYEVPSIVTEIERAAFKGCTNIKKIVLHKGITFVGDYAFYGCKNLTEVTGGEGLTCATNAFIGTQVANKWDLFRQREDGAEYPSNNAQATIGIINFSTEVNMVRVPDSRKAARDDILKYISKANADNLPYTIKGVLKRFHLEALTLHTTQGCYEGSMETSYELKLIGAKKQTLIEVACYLCTVLLQESAMLQFTHNNNTEVSFVGLDNDLLATLLIKSKYYQRYLEDCNDSI